MAESTGSIEFFARYNSWIAARTMDINEGTTPKDVARFLIAVREDADRKAFEILGINLKEIDAYSDTATKNLPKGSYMELVSIYKTLGSADVEEVVNRASYAREELKPFAKAYLLRSALEKLGLDHYITRKNRAFAGNGGTTKSDGQVPFQSQGIVFTAKYGEWISIKKMSIDGRTKPEEVAAHLSSIRMACERKSAEILGLDTGILESYAADMTANMRKSAANLEKITRALDEAGAIKAAEDSCKGDQSLSDAARTYLFSIMLRNLKLDLEVSPDTLMDMFPGLKIPKPRGRMPGQKKRQ